MARLKRDAYYTPAWMTRTLLRRLPVKLERCAVLEPCSGDEAIAEAIKAERGWKHVITNDIDPGSGAEMHHDACAPYLEHALSGFRPWLVTCITNPPYSDWFRIVSHWVDLEVPCAFLLRVTALEPPRSAKNKGRADWLETHPPTGMIVLPRHSFTGDGTDSATCAWFLWNMPPIRIHVVSQSTILEEERRGEPGAVNG